MIILKRIIAGMTAALLAVILVFPFQVHGISAQSALLLDCATGRVLYSKAADQKRLIASTTKIMTALLVCEQCNVLDRVKIPKDAVGVEGSSMYLQSDEILTVQELLYGMMLHSGNDAATALAIYCGGTVDGFVQMMNDKARTLGMADTHFENPHGLDAENHYSTAEDLGKLAAYAMGNPIFAKVVSTKNVQVGERHLKNHNKLLWSVEGADGIKTGYTKKAGRILVSSANRQGRRLVAVTIAAPDDWNDHKQLLETGFSMYTPQKIIDKNVVIGVIEVAGGCEQQVELVAADDFCYSVGNDEEIEVVLSEPGFVYAPVVTGQAAGYAQVYLDDQWIGKVPLTFGSTIEKKEEKPKGWTRLFGGKHHEGTYTENTVSTGCVLSQTGGRDDQGR